MDLTEQYAAENGDDGKDKNKLLGWLFSSGSLIGCSAKHEWLKLQTGEVEFKKESAGPIIKKVGKEGNLSQGTEETSIGRKVFTRGQQM